MFLIIHDVEFYAGVVAQSVAQRIQTSVSGAYCIDPLAVCLQAQRTDEVLSFSGKVEIFHGKRRLPYLFTGCSHYHA